MFAYTAADILAAERTLLAAQREPDELMRQAAQTVAYAVDTILTQNTTGLLAGTHIHSRRAHLAVGPGGNGGDALYAGALLAEAGWDCTATLVAGHAHTPALAAYLAADGRIEEPTAGPAGVLIDGVAGLNSTPGRTWHPDDPALADWPRVSIDIPTGMCPDTGQWGGATPTPAVLTILPGALRAGPAYTPDAGLQLVAPLTLAGRTLTYDECRPVAQAYTARPQPDTDTLGGLWALTPPPLDTHLWDHPAHGHKYTTGVATVVAGSETYPGAGLLAAGAAVATGAGMIRYVAPPACRDLIIAAHPEIVMFDSVRDALSPAQRADVVAIGPGLGVDTAAAALRDVLAPEHAGALPRILVLDAGALTALAAHPVLLADLTAAVKDHGLTVVLTPHEGEFGRLFERRAGWGRGQWAQEFTHQYPFILLLKGRPTLITAAGQLPISVDPGHSRAATAGTGDVLTGLMAGLLARYTAGTVSDTSDVTVPNVVAFAVAAHARAAELSALTPYGPGPTSAHKVAGALQMALADLAQAQL